MSAAAAGPFTIGGDLSVNRLGCVSPETAVQPAYFRQRGRLSVGEPGITVLEMSTPSPELPQRCILRRRTRSLRFLHVAISGSTPAVESGTITLFAGVTKTLRHGSGSFRIYCQTMVSYRAWVVRCPDETGCHLLLGLDVEALAEAVSPGEHLQIDRKLLLAVLSRTQS